MSEHKQGISKHESLFKMSADFEFPDKPSSQWLQDMDITEFDLPYTQQLIQQSFQEWRDEASSLSLMTSSRWAVLNYMGSWVCGDAEINEALQGEDREVVDRCLSTKAFASQRLAGLLDRTEEAGQVICTVPIISRKHQLLVAVLICVLPRGIFDQSGSETISAMAVHFTSCFYKSYEYIFVSDVIKVHKTTEREANRRTILFQIMQRMHDQIDVDTVLTEVLDSINVLYPTITLHLFMSQDHRSSNPRVKPLAFDPWDDDICVHAFKNGRLMLRTRMDDHMEEQVEIAIPMGGKQGTYGVFHLLMTQDVRDDLDLQLVTMMVDTAGNAFENAKMYEQSNLLVHELRLINELTQRLNQSLQLADIYQFANEELLNIFKADYCCFLQFNEEMDALEVMSCNLSSMSGHTFKTDYGFGGLVYEKREPVILSDYHLNPRVSSKLMEETGSKSLIATPLTVNGKVLGAILLTHQNPHFFSYDNYRLLRTLSSHIGLSIGNALLHAELRRMANRDVLTDLYARHYLDEEIQKSQAEDFCGSLVVVDIDQFKQVNDTYGHQKGDQILKEVSEILRTSIRSIDIPARWGGEELAVYLPQLGIQQALKVAEVIRTRVATETNPSVTVSSGIAEWNWMDRTISVDSLFYRADMALYRAKNSGRNQIQMEDTND